MPRAYGTTNASPYASAPAVGAAGDTYYNTADKSLYLSDGTAWNPSGAQGITPATDFNACVTTGLYSIAGNAGNGLPNGGGTSGAAIGILQVFAIDATHITQTFYGGPYIASSEIWNRSCNGGTWNAWDSVMGRIPSLGNFGFAGTNGYYHIVGTAAGGPGVAGAGIMFSVGNPLGIAGLQANTVQTWTSYVTGEIWQRQNSGGTGFTAWARLGNNEVVIQSPSFSGTPTAGSYELWVDLDNGPPAAQGAPVICTSNSRPASPVQGQMIYETDTFRTLFYQTATTGWTPPWNTAWGELGYAEITASSAAIGTTFTDLLNFSITVPANRKTLISGNAIISSSAQFAVPSYSIRQGGTVGQAATGTQLVTANFSAAASSGQTTHSPQVRKVLAAGTYLIRGGTSTNSGTVQWLADPTYPCFLKAEDIGPAGNPA